VSSTPESLVLKSILTYLRLKQVCAFRINNGGVFRNGRWCPSPNQTKGVADILGIHNSKPIAIEVKAKGGKLSADQIVFATQWQAAGGFYCTAYSVEDVKFFLEQVD
jgi:hypothetical protein